jgi:uncharacterized protein
VAQKGIEKKLVLSDASPLIGLAAAGGFELLRRLFAGIHITQTVRDEVLAGGDKPGAVELRAAIAAGWIQVLDDPPVEEPSFAHLGDGEASTLRAALTAKTDTLVILDDTMARSVAGRQGIDCVGTLGIIVVAKRRGLIRAARPYFERLVKRGFYLPMTLLKELSRELGEGS